MLSKAELRYLDNAIQGATEDGNPDRIGEVFSAVCDILADERGCSWLVLSINRLTIDATLCRIGY